METTKFSDEYLRKREEELNKLKEQLDAKEIARIEKEERRKKEEEKRLAFYNKMIEYAMQPPYNFNYEQANLVYYWAWDEGHSYGFDEVNRKMEEYCDKIIEFNNKGA